MKSGIARSCIGASVAAIVLSLLPSNQACAQKSYADFFVGTGDNYVVGEAFPVDSHAFIDATFDMVKSIYGTTRIQWRGLQDQQIKNGAFRPESAFLVDWYEYINKLDTEQNINQYAVEAAHARGLEIWGRGALYDWGDNGNTSTTIFGFPSGYESRLRADNPQWKPVDRFGIRQQSGPIELGYAESRQAIADHLTDLAVNTGYDGVVLQQYNENYSTRFADEFGFNEPVVQAYQDRYGIDLRRARSLTPTQIQNFRDLRGEFTTQLLDTMHAQLNAQGIGLGMEVNGYTDPSIPSLWLLDSPYPETGIITQEWKKWVDEGTVDDLWLRRGITDPGGIEVYNYAQGSGVTVSAYVSNPLNSAFNAAEAKGVTMIGTSFTLADVVRNGNVPSQGISALTSTDPNKRMKILQQVITGNSSATVSQVAPLVSDSNILVRRLALEALGEIGSPTALPILEAALQDPENGIRTGALLGLRKLNASTPTTLQKILEAMPLGESPAMLDEARYVILQMPAATVDPVLADAMVNSPHAEVRKLAARTMWGRISTLPDILDYYMQASNDPDPYVRFFAIENQYYASPTNASLDMLVSHMNGDDTVTSYEAADTLGNYLKAGYGTARARETELVQALADRFAELGDDSSDPNSEWAYEPIGRALFNSTNYGGSQKKRRSGVAQLYASTDGSQAI